MANDKPHPSRQVDLADEQIQWDLADKMSYSQYLELDSILTSQTLRSGCHDEMLFIVIHQVSELWMKLILHELQAAIQAVQNDTLEPCFKMLSRVSQLQNQLKQSWDVLSTMTPAEYVEFRDSLGHSSGFQSWQYRLIEFLLGNKNSAMIEVHRHDQQVFEKLDAALNAPSFYDECLRLLHRRGLSLPKDTVERDWSKPYQKSKQVEQAWLACYQNRQKYWDLYELAEELVDVEDNFQQWRFRHMTTVKRVIGFKRGTGGTSGVEYLSKALQLQFFPELWELRTSI